MARIAFVQTHPYDADLGGDAAYILAFAHYLAKAGHDVHGLVSDITRGRTSPVYRSAYPIEKFQSWQVRQTVQLGPKTFVGSPIGLIRKLANRIDLGSDIDAWAPREAAWVDKTLARLRPDATVLVHDAVHLAPYLDTVSARFALVGHIPSRRNRLGSGGDQKRSDDEEMLAGSLQKVDGIGFNSRDDIAYASQHLSDGEMLFIGMGYPDAPQSPASAEPVVLFVGNATVPNRAALGWFLERCWPGVIAAHPAARFRVLGQIAFSDQAKPTPSVEYIGPVPDLATEYQRAQVVVAPLVAGTAGVKIKVAEAIAYGRPIVTTSIGVDGEDKHQLDAAAIIADEPDDFARGIVQLLANDALRAAKSAGAIQVFAKQFSYGACYGEFTTWLDRAVLRKSRRSRNLAAARRAQSAVSAGPR
jgi:glycosyltransferase involved in cell wall biosynthesis